MSEIREPKVELVRDDRDADAQGFSENALRVLRARYLIKNEDGQCTESPRDLFSRVAGAIAEVELQYGGDDRARSEWEERFLSLMMSQRFMPNSPTLMNAGREMGMLSACFVLPVPDRVDGIFDSIKHTALIQKAGGGTGFAFDELRPTGDYISTSGGTTSGPISFWRAFSEATNAIQQGAFRRGANMGMMYIHHPDILKFLHAKQDLTQFNNYNISVKVTDAWMDTFLADPDGPHVVMNPRTGRRYLLPKPLDVWQYTLKTLVPESEKQDDQAYYTRADIWDIIIQNAWKTGEPGVVFIDRINQDNPTPHIGRIEATNPCGEQPLLPYEACNLGSINLAKFVTEVCSEAADLDWSALRETIHDSIRFLDNVIDANRYPLREIDEICKANRKIGLGIMGFADALYMLGVGYDTDEGVAWGERIMRFVNDESHVASERLAGLRGVFPNWKGSTWDTKHQRPMRNATCTTVAPTGTISIIASCSCGIEPLYSLAFYRNVLRGQEQGRAPMLEVNEIFSRVARERGLVSEGLMERIAKEGTLAGISDVPDDLRRVFVCAHDVAPEWHVRMQAAFQEHCDASISKTINFPEQATPEDVNRIYLDSYALRCKGVTVYRNNCRSHQPMALGGSDGSKTQAGTAVSATQAKQPMTTPEPRLLKDIACAVRIRQMTPFGNMHVQITVDLQQDQELEVFAQLGKGGDLANSDLEAICRLTSLWLRSGGKLHHVIRQLKGIGSSLQIPTKEGKVRSLGDGLSRALAKYVRAKAMFGMRNLLIGDFDPAELGGGGSTGAGHHHINKTHHVNSSSLVTADGGGRNGQGETDHGRNGNGQNGYGHADDQGVNGKSGHPGSNGNGTGSPSALQAGARVPVAEDSGLSLVDEERFKVICPDCHSPLRFAEGCIKCEICGYSHC